MTLYFIRHAEPDYENDVITQNGHEQAEKLALYLSDIKVDELYHSTMGRAKLTAGYLAQKWQILPKAIDWARELKWGKATGDKSEELSPWVIKDKYIKENHCYPSGENWKELTELKNAELVKDFEEHCKNFDAFLAENGYERNGQLYKATNPNEKCIVIVCHGGVISALVSHLMNVPFFQYISHLGVDLTSVTKVQFVAKKNEILPAELVYINSQAHLGVK